MDELTTIVVTIGVVLALAFAGALVTMIFGIGAKSDK